MSSHPTMLIVGCGYLGRNLGDTWHANQVPLVGVTRSPESAEALREAGWEARALNIADRKACAELAAEFPRIEVVVHCAASGRGGGEPEYAQVYREGGANLQQSFPSARLFFTSSTSVYPQIDGSVVTEESLAEPRRGTGKILREAETLILAGGGTVLRLAGLYGPGRSVLLRNFIEGKSTIDVRTDPPLTPDGRWINQLHQADAVAAIQHLVALPAQFTAGQIFNGCDSRPQRQREVYEFLAANLHLPLPPESVPDETRKRGWSHKRVSNAKLQATGWSPKFPDYFAAFENDPALVPSIFAQLEASRTDHILGM